MLSHHSQKFLKYGHDKVLLCQLIGWYKNVLKISIQSTNSFDNLVGLIGIDQRRQSGAQKRDRTARQPARKPVRLAGKLYGKFDPSLLL